MAMLLQPLTLLLFGVAWAQQKGAATTIEDILATSKGQQMPVPSSAQAMLPPTTYDNSVGQAQSALGAATSDPGQSLGQQLGATPSAALPAVQRPASSPAVLPPVPASTGPSSPASSGPSSPFSSPASSSSDSDDMDDAMKGLSSMKTGGDGKTDAKMGELNAMMGMMKDSMGGGKAGKKDMFGRRPGDASVPGGIQQAGAPGAAPAPATGIGALFGGGGGGNVVMDSLLDSVEARMPANKAKAAASGIAPAISTESRLIVSGIVEAFMHKVALADGEKSCLEDNLATLTADIVGTTEDIIRGVKAIIAGRNSSETMGVSAAAQGTMVSAGMDGAMKITSLATLASTLMKNCVRGDALDMLKETGEHFINMQYVGHRLLVSGVDVAHRLADAIISYEAKNWHRFGEDIGISIRKILLSNSTRSSRLPEGVPEEAIIQATTEGLMSGFFRAGTGVEITDAAAPDVDIQLDLHRCIAGNHEFFKEIWLALWNLIAELSVQVGNHDFHNPFNDMGGDDGSQPKWMGEIMVAMMQVPSALARCNIDKDTQEMLMQAIKSIKYLKVHFLFPQHVITGDEATQRMAKAIEAWTRWDFKGFGEQIGKLLREFVLLMYPQQYSVDSTGRLRRQLIGASAVTKGLKVGGLSLSTSFMALIAGGVALSILVALVAMRSLRSTSFTRYQEPHAHDDDLEFSGELLEVE